MTTNGQKRQKTRKPLLINAFVMGCAGLQNPGLWKHPKDSSHRFNQIDHWTYLAKLAEKGKFNALFIADVLGGYDVYKGPENLATPAVAGAQWPVTEPSAVVSAMAAVTTNLAFGVTFSTISEAPYHFARRLSTLDHLTKGRIGWNVVSSYLESAARNLLNGEKLDEHDQRYLKAEEYIQIVYELLLSSWRDDAVVLDKKAGVYTDPTRFRKINFEGKFFKVPGPHIVDPTPQRLPVILQAGTSKVGKEFAAKHAEIVFVISFSPDDLKPKIAEVRQLAKEKFGRNHDDIKFVALATPVIGATHELAEEKYQELLSYGDIEGAQALFGGWTGIDLSQYGEDEELGNVSSNAMRGAVQNWTKAIPNEKRWTRKVIAKQITVGGLGPAFVGTPEEIADELEHWSDHAGLDGFNFTYAVNPLSFEEIVEDLIPVLQRRGLAQKEYPNPETGSTFRKNLFGTDFVPSTHPAYNLRWRAGVSKEEFEKSLSK